MTGGRPGVGHPRVQGDSRKKLVRPKAKCAAIRHLQDALGLSERRACRTTRMHRSSCRYQHHRKDDSELRARIRAIAEERRRFGQRRIHAMLRREGVKVNHKRVERIYREEKLSLRLKHRWKRPARLRLVLDKATRVNQHWSMDFVHDTLYAGRRFRVFTLVDDYSREGLATEADISINGERVTKILDRVVERRGKPEVIICDNGPEFAGQRLDEWAHKRGIKLHFITPGRPAENAYCESFIGRLRDECLNEYHFLTLEEARERLASWTRDYNEVRPHGSLNAMTPPEFDTR